MTIPTPTLDNIYVDTAGKEWQVLSVDTKNKTLVIFYGKKEYTKTFEEIHEYIVL